MNILNSLESAVSLLRSGKIGILPTDTVYGLVAVAAAQTAVSRLYSLKNRENKPGTLIAASTDQLINLGIDRRDIEPVEHLWPDSLSIVIPVSNKLSYLHQDTGSLAVRVPKNEHIRHLLELTGPLITSSANHPGKPPANNLQEAIGYFGDTIDFYIDGGDLSGREPSTVARITNGTIEIIRPGAVKL